MVLYQLTVLLLQLAVSLLIGLGFPCMIKDQGEESTWLGLSVHLLISQSP